MGIIHLLPEVLQNYSPNFPSRKEHFPFAFLTVVLAFTTVLLIEKIIADDHHSHNEDEHHRKTTIKALKEGRKITESDHHQHEINEEIENNKPQDSDLQHMPKMVAHAFDISQNLEPSAVKKKLLAENGNSGEMEDDEMEEAFKDVMRTASRMAKRITTIAQNSKKKTESVNGNEFFSRFLRFFKVKEPPKEEKKVFVWAPYILQVVIGIHAVISSFST